MARSEAPHRHADPDQAGQNRPADQHFAGHLAVEHHDDQSRADQVGAEQEQGELASGVQLRRPDRTPIGGVRRIVQTKQRADVDPRGGELGRGLRAHSLRIAPTGLAKG